MLTQTLPEELLDLIFGCMHDDKVSLSHCSRVCRTWLSPSSRYLFRELDVHPQPESPDTTTSDWYAYFLHGMRAVTAVDTVLWTEENKDVVRKCVTHGIQRVVKFM